MLDDNEETKILPTSSSRFGYANPKDHGFSQETLKIQVEPSIHKSRRIENTKRNVFNSKLNKILFAVIFLDFACFSNETFVIEKELK